MSFKFEQGKDLILDAVVEKIHEKMKGRPAALSAEFFRQFFGTVSLDDLREWSIEDLYGATINFWSLITQRNPNETKIRIYNPDFERDGWQTTHTVIEVICDDMAFLVDSLRLILNRMKLGLHLIIHMGGIRLVRDEAGNVSQILPRQGETVPGAIIEAPIFMEIDRRTDPALLDELYQQLYITLQENRAVVDDWALMRDKVREVIDEIDTMPSTIDRSEIEETKAFLNWIEDHHFTFLGIEDNELVEENGEVILRPVPGTGLGVLREGLAQSKDIVISSMTPEAQQITVSSQILVISKTNTLSTVHRDAYTDYIGVKRFDAKPLSSCHSQNSPSGAAFCGIH